MKKLLAATVTDEKSLANALQVLKEHYPDIKILKINKEAFANMFCDKQLTAPGHIIVRDGVIIYCSIRSEG